MVTIDSRMYQLLVTVAQFSKSAGLKCVKLLYFTPSVHNICNNISLLAFKVGYMTMNRILDIYVETFGDLGDLSMLQQDFKLGYRLTRDRISDSLGGFVIS